MILNKERFTLLALMITAVALRLHTNFSTEYIGGNNGAYYLVLVRNLVETGDIRYLDFPLIFKIEAWIAGVIYKLGAAPLHTAIDLSSRWFDSVVPNLSIISAYLLAKKILAHKEKWFIPIIFASISVFYFSFLVLVSDFQKNSLGLLWLFWLLYFIYRIHEEPTRTNYLFALLFFVLTGLTHYGCIAVALSMVIVDLIVKCTLAMNWKKILKAVAISVIIILSCLLLVYLATPWRYETFIKIPYEIFKEPILIFILNRKPVLSPFDIVNLLLVNATAITALILYIKKYSSIEQKIRPFILTMIILSFFLASPFLGLNSAQRLYFTSYLTAIPLLVFIYLNLKNEMQKSILVYFVIALLVISVLVVNTKGQQSNMSKRVYSEMLKLDSAIPKNERTLIVARHGMEFWSEWIYKVDAIREDALTENYWKYYKDIFILHQKKGKSNFGPAGAFGPKFTEPALPEGSFLIGQSEYFELYKAPIPPKDFSIFKPKR